MRTNIGNAPLTPARDNINTIFLLFILKVDYELL